MQIAAIDVRSTDEESGTVCRICVARDRLCNGFISTIAFEVVAIPTGYHYMSWQNGFEWDDAKATANYKKHGVRFEQAVVALEDAFALVEFDDSEEYGEDRFLLTGRAAGSILVIVFTERKGRVRIISAREATEHERRNYFRAAQED